MNTKFHANLPDENLAVAQAFHGDHWSRMTEDQREWALQCAGRAISAYLALREVDGLIVMPTYTLNTRTGQVFNEKGALLPLSAMRYNLLLYLTVRRGKTCVSRDILRSVWGVAMVDRVEYVRVAIHALRDTLGHAAIVSMRPEGYMVPDVTQVDKKAATC